MRRAFAFGFAAVLLMLCFGSTSWAQGKKSPVFPPGNYCDVVDTGLCTELAHIPYRKYIGHDEPSIAFYSNKPGSGNTGVYLLRLPKDPKTQPTQDGTNGVTWNFEQHPTFWAGMAMCDTQSDPIFTNVCNPDTDDNIFDDPNPSAPDFIGKHPGVAFMELQFYPPGWNGNDCYPTTWCGAMTIDSYGFQEATGTPNNAACANTIGLETVNFAFITFTGKSQAAADPVSRFNDPTFAASIPDPAQTVSFNPGDLLFISIHDTPDGFRADVVDLTSGVAGSMTASIANGFGQVNFDPTATTCTSTPYAFHPMYSTSSEHTRVVWAAHAYNAGFSDEIGHFEFCDGIAFEFGPCTVGSPTDPGSPDSDDVGCADNSGFPTLPQVTGCQGSDFDFDGPPYKKASWAGGTRDNDDDRKLRPEPVTFIGPVFVDKHGRLRNYKRVAFETDLPALEPNSVCNHLTGVGCLNPPPGAEFYPFYTTTEFFPGVCAWQEGGGHIRGTTNNFGGTPTAAYGGVTFNPYIDLTNSIILVEDFRNIQNPNPCQSPLGGDDDDDN
jgi:hypothetical protein